MAFVAAMCSVLFGIFWELKCGLRSSDAARTGHASQRWLKSRSVVPVYLRCDQGRVTWRYPRGALRVLLRLGGTGSGGARDFRVCVKVATNSTGAAVHLEGHRRLIPIFKGQPASSRLPEEDDEVRRCFTSYQGQVALFLEATPEANHLLSRDTFRLWYHLTPVMSQRDLDDDMADTEERNGAPDHGRRKCNAKKRCRETKTLTKQKNTHKEKDANVGTETTGVKRVLEATPR
ncbi:hypothetical protein HPB48_015767 [Haemaphysalis longicornis]|uniref:Secreted protein n=1 Tax=Haemaphysalis longicornis TaxID=44386 RepID=A0A9J6FQQ3_HAELO|nr:hypothetical protein HPB48_015767 [Haemaphysalis longicornis]